MENELVKENKRVCDDISSIINNQIANLKEKGLNDADLAPLKSLGYDVSLIRHDKRRSQSAAEENRKALVGIQNKLDYAIGELSNLANTRAASRKTVEINKFMKLRKEAYDVYQSYTASYVAYDMDRRDLNKITFLFNDITNYVKDYKDGKISNTVAADYANFENRLNTICSEINEKIAQKEKEIKKEAKEPELIIEDDPEVYEAKTKEPKSKFWKRVLQVTLAGAAILALVCGLKSCSDKKKNDGERGLDPIDPPAQTDTIPNPGEYGTFTDINDPEQFQARVDYIYNIYQNFEGKTTDGRNIMMYSEHKEKITKEAIANLMRQINGLPPVNENGDYYFNTNVRKELQNDIADFFMMIPSGVYDENDVKYYTVVPSHLFVPDNSNASKLLKESDDIYQRFSDAYNRGDWDAAYKAGQDLMKVMFYEWNLDGAEGMMNPYSDLPANLISFAKKMVVDRWGLYFYEFEQDGQFAICTPLCVDYKTKEMVDVRGDELKEALTYDLWNEPIAKSAGMEDEVDLGRYQNQVFMDWWMEYMQEQYEMNFKGKNINDNQSLTLGN